MSDAVLLPAVGNNPATTTQDMDGYDIVTDSDGNSRLELGTDNEIGVYLNSALDFTFKANAFELESGSVIQGDSASKLSLGTNGAEVLTNAAGTSGYQMLATGNGNVSLLNIAGSAKSTLTTNTLYPTHSTATTAPVVNLTQESTGDAAQAFILSGGNSYAVGIDNSDSDSFKVSYNAAGAPVLGTSDLLTITTAGAISGASFAATGAVSGASATFTGTSGTLVSMQGNYNGEVDIRLRNANSGSSAFTQFLIGNDANVGAFGFFINSSNRSADGGVNGVTLRAGVGDLTFGDNNANRLTLSNGAATWASVAHSGITTLGTTGKVSVICNSVGAPAETAYALDARCAVSGGFVASFFNDGNHVDRYGVLIQTGEDIESGTNYFIVCRDGDGAATGHIASVAGVLALTDSSDANLKRDVRPTKVPGLDTINGIECREFRYKKQGVNGRLHSIGFIAQNLQQVFPEAVSETIDGTLGVSKAHLIPVLVKAVQELSAEVEALKAR